MNINCSRHIKEFCGDCRDFQEKALSMQKGSCVLFADIHSGDRACPHFTRKAEEDARRPNDMVVR